ncbi:hypothetical protein GGQ80_003523 [Sphingomonas jinjuensis]|uniref:STAS/SEC14 domain-containing protein n=1 Tax=Sphingomonas jinjuensis TaxID=535907 RepID=A0A840FNY5_9SPHN|nr:hypothetical protein [Sphingomonas jinjuensis]MBB4155598.1 hypothetical protein [Sphingomonas jinjuensis]
MTLSGLWTADPCFRCQQALASLLARHPVGGHETRLGLYDLLDFPVQPQPVVAGLATVVADNIIGSARNAILTRTALLTSQLRSAAPDYRIFADRGEALAWLTGTELAAA